MKCKKFPQLPHLYVQLVSMLYLPFYQLSIKFKPVSIYRHSPSFRWYVPAQQCAIPGSWLQLIDIRTEVFGNELQGQCTKDSLSDIRHFSTSAGEENRATNLCLFAAKSIFKAFALILRFSSLN